MLIFRFFERFSLGTIAYIARKLNVNKTSILFTVSSNGTIGMRNNELQEHNIGEDWGSISPFFTITICSFFVILFDVEKTGFKQ